MPNFRLYYFDVRGRGELIRLIFAYAGVPFDDFRFREIDGVSQWFHEYKAKMPFGKAPVLEVDGEMLAQSTAIARYLARKFGIAGKNEWDMALADMYIECLADFIVAYSPLYYESDAGKLKALEKKFLEETVCPYLEKIENRLEKNGSGFLVGPELTYADLAHFNYLDFLNGRFPEEKLLDGKLHINALLERVGSIESVKNYVASHMKHKV